MKEEREPCKHCGFDQGFIKDYKKDGTEYEFCHNCGTVVGEGDKE